MSNTGFLNRFDQTETIEMTHFIKTFCTKCVHTANQNCNISEIKTFVAPLIVFSKHTHKNRNSVVSGNCISQLRKLYKIEEWKEVES